MIRVIIALIVGATATTLLAGIAHTQFNVASLMDAGLEVPMSVRLEMTTHDIVGLAPAYGGIILIAFAIAFVIARQVKRQVPSLSSVAYPVAGAAGLALALLLMNQIFGTVAISSTRSGLGLSTHLAAAAVGGWIFARLIRTD